MKVEMGKKYTSNGEPIRILCIDRPIAYPVIGMVELTGDIEHFKDNGENMAFSSHDLVEVWEPQEGEWCWFWDDRAHNNAHLRKYSEMYLEMGRKFFVSADGYAWYNCAKFTGEIPEHLKD